ALAASGNLFPILFLMISFMMGLGSATNVLIGQAHGAGDEARVKNVAGTSLGLALAGGIVIGTVCAIFAVPLLRLIGTPSDIFAVSLVYARTIFAALPLLFAFLIYSTCMRGMGDSRLPFYFLMLYTGLQMLVTPALIFGWFGLPKIGVLAAAWGTIVSSAIGLFVVILTLRAMRSPLALGEVSHALVPRGRLPMTLFRIGAPAGMQLMLISLAEIAVISFVNRFGSDATAAYAAVNQITSYVQFPAVSIGIAASIFGAQSIGAGKTERMRKVVHAAVGLNYLLEGALILIAYLFANWILGLFLTSPQTHAIARGLLNITLWSYAIFGNAAVLGGIVRSSGDVLFPTAISVASIWLVEVPVAWVLSHRIGLAGIWYGYPAAFAVNLIAQFAYYKLVWRRKPLRAIV
ncbi:MAG: MATE family efflux transporter, partial [Candidatus Eremiobacteraeota bacterium]|nr:MATE family efflux transporter [Candidatus Eremiobacteraeota bacterium]